MDFGQLKPLQERAKELQCIYSIENILSDRSQNLTDVFYKIMDGIPQGWQFPSVCHVKITYNNKEYKTTDISLTDWAEHSELIVDNNIVGKISVFYSDFPFQGECFLPEEQKLLNTIADRLSHFIFLKQLENTIEVLSKKVSPEDENAYLKSTSDEHWHWRYRMAEHIASKTDFVYYGIHAMYIIGSTKETTAGPASDIDFLVHIKDNQYKTELFKSWISGWSHALAEMNKQKTGYAIHEGIIDLHLITDEDIKNKTSFAVMIGNLYNSARLLKKEN